MHERYYCDIKKHPEQAKQVRDLDLRICIYNVHAKLTCKFCPHAQEETSDLRLPL